ncbi:hypothetical protein CRE_14792 [Caenorhabditis remanei]|uniref:Uncharacterized protein n=1 Tax=Caenorhabditis remanei TaxID=31234 RepID=E3MRR0_CAERE|nr:hypothetical protein CRE_14792 [Caenorhabditis remanei]
MSRGQRDNFPRDLNHPRGRFQQTQHRNSRGNQQNETQFNPNASEFIPQGTDGNSFYNLGGNTQNTSLPAVPSSYSGHNIHRNQSRSDSQGRFQNSGLISLPVVPQNQIFASRPAPHNPPHSDTGYHTPYQHTGNFHPINTSVPREQQDVPNMVSGQPTNYVPQQQQLPIPYGGIPIPPPVIQIMPAQGFMNQYNILWNQHQMALHELARLRGDAVARPMESVNNYPEVSPSRNVVDAGTQTDAVTHMPRETQTYVTSASIGVQYEEISVEEGPPVSTTEVSLPSHPPACDSTKIQLAEDVKSDLTSSVAVSIDSTPEVRIIDSVENGSGPSTNMTSKSSEVHSIASSLPVGVHHKETSGVKSPEVPTFVSSQSTGDKNQDKYGTTGEKDRSLGVSPSKSYASVAAVVTGPVENTKLPTSSKCASPTLAKNVKSGSNFESVSPVKDARNSAKNPTVPSTSGTSQCSKVSSKVSSTKAGHSSKNTSGDTTNRVQKKDKPVGRDVKSTSSNFETSVASSDDVTTSSCGNCSFQPDSVPEVIVTSPDTQTQEMPPLKVSQETRIDVQGPPKEAAQISKILETATPPADKETLRVSFNESSLEKHKEQSEANQMENSENIAPIQSKQPTKSPKKSKPVKKGKSKATEQDKKQHDLELRPDDDEEELNRAIEKSKEEADTRIEAQRFIHRRVIKYFEAMDRIRYEYLAFIKERPKGHEFLEEIMEYWKQNLSQLHNLDYHRSDKKIESLLNSRITKYSLSQDEEDWKLCLFFKSIYNMFKKPDTEFIVLQDLLFLFNGMKSDFVQKSLDTEYCDMVACLDYWLEDWENAWRLSKPSLSAADLPINSLDQKSIRTFVRHINEQAKNRYLIYKGFSQMVLDSNYEFSNVFQKIRKDKLDWSQEKTKELFQERCEFWRNVENRNSDQSKFILYYELLASITSSVIDFDAHHLHKCIQNISKKDPERIWVEELKFMSDMFSFVASGDVISKS